MQQVADWLEKLGLGQYAQRFAENDISFSVLPDLTDQHLKEIGVSLGHRLQLLRAIANLDKAAVSSAPPIAAAAPIADGLRLLIAVGGRLGASPVACVSDERACVCGAGGGGR
jgi:SAM domain (Sterile alpha motif)